MNIVRLFLSFFLLAGLGCSSSSSQQAAPTSQETVAAENLPADFDPHLRSVIEWAVGRGDSVIYQQRMQGEVVVEEPQWTYIEALDSARQYLYRELFNIYQDEKGRVTYYLSESRFDLGEQAEKQLWLEYQIVVKPDTAFMSQATESLIKVSASRSYTVETDTFKVWKMLGYAHVMDEEPSFHKYWSPRLGTVLVWYGEDTYFRPIYHPGVGNEDLLSLLVQQILQEEGYE